MPAAPLLATFTTVDPGEFVVVVLAAALAGTVSTLCGARGLVVPAVVLELVFGVVLGPEVLGGNPSEFLQFFADLGLGMLFFFAGYEIDVGRIAGAPLRLAAVGWALSLVLAYTIGGLLAAAGIVLSLLYTGSALATTAIGTLIPILSDSGELKTRFGTYLLAGGAVGEFGPIVLLTLFLSSQKPLHSAAILLAFIAAAVAVALLAVRSSHHTIPLFERTIEKSSQLAVRWIVVLVFALLLLAGELGLDLLLGGFAAGVITRQVMRADEVKGFDSKLTAVAYGIFVPFFFVVSGMQLDVAAVFAGSGGVAKLFLFFALFLVVRGVPAVVLYRDVLDERERLALAFFQSTQLPLVLAITTLAMEAGEMRSSTAAALVCAAVLSTLVFPLIGLRLRREAPAPEAVAIAATPALTELRSPT